MKARTLSTAIALGLAVVSGSAFAITNVESNASIPFSFSNPGARSLAMGGAFIGAADDATAAFSNPAGLTNLGIEQQVSIEVRRNRFITPYAAGGTAGTGPFDLSGVDYRGDENDINSLSYIGWVLPRDNWALSLYRHQMIDFENSFNNNAIFFEGDLEGNFIFPYDIATDLEVATYGASFAYNLNDQLSVGAGISWHDFSLRSSTIRYISADADTLDRSFPANTQTQRGEDDDIGFNVGLLWKGEKFNVGATYRSAPEFSYRSTNTIINILTADGIVPVADALPGIDPQVSNFTTPFKAPDVFGLGISYRANDSVTVNLDINRVGYSNLTDEVDDALFGGGPFEAELSNPALLDAFEIDDVVEPRMGVEYTFIDMANPLSLRGGVWQEKQHTLKFTRDPGSADFANDANTAAAEAVIFSTGHDEIHWSLGFGLAFKNFQVDMAYDHSDIQKTASLSGVYRF